MVGCIRPGEINDDEVIGYAAGEAPRRVRDHVRGCPRCTALARQYAADEDRLGIVLFRFDCPSSLELGEYHLGLLSEVDRQRVGVHLTLCPHCAAELALAADYLDAPDPRPALASGAPAATRLRETAERAIQRLIAQLVPPAVPSPALALRGRGRPRSLVYTAGDLTLTLHPQAADKPRGQMQLLGFVHRQERPLDSLTGASARLLAGAATAATATVDEIGNFIIGPVPPGVYELEVTTAEVQVVVPDLAMTAS